MNFSENLQELRKNKKISQEDLAEKLEVSRQAVSKWESGTGYPETEKIIKICEIFGCSMDELIKGKISDTCNKEKNTYEKTFNKLSKGTALGVFLILLGVTIMLTIQGFIPNPASEEKYGIIGVVILLTFIVVAVPIFIVQGIETDRYKEKNPFLKNFYTEEEIDSYNHKFSIMIAIAVAMILIGVVFMMGTIGLGIFSDESPFAVSILMGFISLAVPILIYAGIQKDKYDIDKYNKENTEEFKKIEEKISRICGVIMLTTTAIYLLISFIWNSWEISWVVYPVGGILCGVVSTILSKEK